MLIKINVGMIINKTINTMNWIDVMESSSTNNFNLIKRNISQPKYMVPMKILENKWIY